MDNFKGHTVLNVSQDWFRSTYELVKIYDSSKLYRRDGRYITEVEKEPKADARSYFYNVISSFDIECTSIVLEGDQKVGTMYIWQWLIGDVIFYGRTWDDFKTFCQRIVGVFNLTYKINLVVFVHNLTYEFQFLKTKLYFDMLNGDVFVRNSHDILNATSQDGFVFRDSYAISNASLAETMKSIGLPDEEKLPYNYDIIRSCEYQLSNDELSYCLNDVHLVGVYISELLKKYKYVARIPMTMTSMAVCDLKMESNRFGWEPFKSFISDCRIHSVEEFHRLNWAMHGGFTYSKYNDTDADGYSEIEYNVKSRDAKSFYPSQSVLRKFPHGEPEILQDISYDSLVSMFVNEDGSLNDNRFIVGTFVLHGVSPVETDFLVMQYNHLLPIEYCEMYGNSVDYEYYDGVRIINRDACISHNRIKYARQLAICCTLQDMLIYETFYNIEKIEVDEAYVYKCDYFPQKYVEYLLKLFQGKERAETKFDRSRAKTSFNSLAYGAHAKSPCKDAYSYSESEKVFVKLQHDYRAEIDDYNSRIEVSAFIIGVAATSFARFELFSIMSQMDPFDIVYVDTDGIKYQGEYDDLFNEYNEHHRELVIQTAMRYHIPSDMFYSEDDDSYIGEFVDEGLISRIRCLSTKKYIMEKDEEIIVHVSGLPKAGQKYYNFDNFVTKGDRYIDGVRHSASFLTAEESHRKESIYINHPVHGSICDAQGHRVLIYEESSIFVSGAPFSLDGNESLFSEAFMKGESAIS